MTATYAATWEPLSAGCPSPNQWRSFLPTCLCPFSYFNLECLQLLRNSWSTFSFLLKWNSLFREALSIRLIIPIFIKEVICQSSTWIPSCPSNFKCHPLSLAELHAITKSYHSPEILLHAKASHETFFPTELLTGPRSREYCPCCANDETELLRGQVTQSLNQWTLFVSPE